MRTPTMHLVFWAALATSLAGCSGATDGDSESTGEAVVERREIMSRALRPQVAPPTDGDIGRTIDDVFSRERGDRALMDESPRDGCSSYRVYGPPITGTEEYRLCGRAGQLHVSACGRLRSVVRIDDDHCSTVTWEDRSGDGKIDYFGEPYRQVTDRNEDGKPDLVMEWNHHLKAGEIVGFEPGWRPPSKPVRTREDTDYDGMLDRESVGAAAGSTWWAR